MENKERKLKDHPEKIEQILADYMTGQYTINTLVSKYGFHPFQIAHQINMNRCRERMEEMGVPIPREPRPDFKPISKEICEQVEEAYMSEMPQSEIIEKFKVTKSWLGNKISKGEWAKHRERIRMYRQMKVDAESTQAKIEKFEEMSRTALDLATTKMNELYNSLKASKSPCDIALLERVMQGQRKLYEQVQNLPIKKNTGHGNGWKHPALRPAPLITDPD